MESCDLSPSTLEFLEKEQFCLDEHKNTVDDNVCTSMDIKICTNSFIAPTEQISQSASPTSVSPQCSSDDEIASLILKMREHLSPRDLEFLKNYEGKDVEELLKDTEEFMHKTSYLIENLSSNSGSSKSNCSEVDISQKQLNDPNIHVDELLGEMKKISENYAQVSNDYSDVKVPSVSKLNQVQSNSSSSLQRNSELKKESSFEIIQHDDSVPHISSPESDKVNNDGPNKASSETSSMNDIDIPGVIINGLDELNSEQVEVNIDKIDTVICNGVGDSFNDKNDVIVADFNIVNTTLPSIIQLVTEHAEYGGSDEKNVNFGSSDSALQKIVTNNYKNDNHKVDYLITSDNEEDLNRLRHILRQTEVKHQSEIDNIIRKYEDEILKLKDHINILHAKIAKYESSFGVIETGNGDSKNMVINEIGKDLRISKMKAEIENQEHLIAGYQRENKKLCEEISKSKENWKKEKLQLEEKIQSCSKLDDKNLLLQDQLKDAQEIILKNQLDLEKYKASWNLEKSKLEEKIRVASSLDSKNLILQSQLKDAQENNVKFQLELENYKMEKMNDELIKWQMDNLPVESSNDFNLEIDSLKIMVTQLQAALNVERTQKKNLSRDKDLLLRENMDLKRQVREVESIIKRRSQSDSTLSKAGGESKLKDLEKELQARQAAVASMQAQLEEMQVKYNDHIAELEQRLKSTQEENNMLIQQLDIVNRKDCDNITASGTNPTKRNVTSSHSVIPSSSSQSNRPASVLSGSSCKEDAHLLATIRGMKLELAKKDKDILKLNKDLEDARKTNRRLQREREKALKTVSSQKSSSVQNCNNVLKIDNKGTSTNHGRAVISERQYNQSSFEEEKEGETALLEMENKSLREEIKRLGQDIVTLHTQRIQDLRTLQSEHEQEIQRLLSDYSNRHSQSMVAELQGQIYTHQMVISHLKEQLKQVSDLKEESAMLKLERDHLEKALIAANKRIQELKTPESQQYQNLLEKFENLEQRHEVREQKLQNIVRDLLARSSDAVPCGAVCRSKLLDKNREICYYRVEMDRILEALREFKRSK